MVGIRSQWKVTTYSDSGEPMILDYHFGANLKDVMEDMEKYGKEYIHTINKIKLEKTLPIYV